MARDVWVLGAAGRSGKAIATALYARGIKVVLVGRTEAPLRTLASTLGSARVVVGDRATIEEALGQAGPVVVMNTIGPFTATAVPLIRATAPGSHVLDLSNELTAFLEVLALHDEMVASGRCIVTGAGFGVLGTESVVKKLCEGRPPAERVRVAVMPFVDAPGPIGPTLAATILDGIPEGLRHYEHGRLVKTGFGSDFEELVLPDGTRAKTAVFPSGDLEAARRTSGASFVASTSSMSPSGLLVRLFMPLVAALLSWRPLRELAKRRLATVMIKPATLVKPSWTHARVEWADGTKREGWLRLADASDFTARSATEVACRLAHDEGKPGAYTPAALFGAELAEQAGGTFVLA